MPNQIVPQSNQNLVKTGDFQTLLQQVLNKPMKSRPYTALITRACPSAMVFLIDQSGSMSHEMLYKNVQMPKSEAVATIVNDTLREVLNRCTKSTELRDYFDFILIGYGVESETANIAWQGTLSGREFVNTTELNNNIFEEKEIEETKVIRGNKVTNKKTIKTWLSPKSEKLTPMNSALNMAADLLEKWLVNNKGIDVFPPIVFNITDGEATDAKAPELLKSALRIKSLHTNDGNVLLLNIHISSSKEQSVLFPQSINQLPDDEYAKLLYNMSSEMPTIYNSAIANLTGTDTHKYFTGMSFNADTNALINIMEIGTLTYLGRTTIDPQ
jgi:hypothetical protein